MTEHLDPYGTWGTWALERFESELDNWRVCERPPAEAHDEVQKWWPRLEYPDERAAAQLVERCNSADSAPDETDVWGLWVPGVFISDPELGLCRVQCMFRLYEMRGHRVVCEAFHTSAWR